MKKTPKLYLCGLGHFPPYTTSLNVLHALGRCDIIVSLGLDSGVGQDLDEFCPGVRRLSFDEGTGAAAAKARVVRELGRGRAVGWVTRGHPMLYGRSAGSLVKHCERAGIDCETFGTVSSIGIVLARLKKTLGIDMDGVQAYEWRALGKAADFSRQPLIVVFESGALKAPEVSRLARLLKGRYGVGHSFSMMGPTYDAPVETFRLGEIESRYPEILPTHILYLPASR